ncbi:MAG: RpoL/Rpb11 RNA polymerase subunit family protein [Thermoproteota archaeon]|jgi:DNA-directed RNA polymerase subunit L|nr:RpoL/Rpb11 RNA polymerase subunit family protein [Thermoproteota archaeon]
MEFNVKEKTNNSILLSFKDLDIGFLNLLAYELLKDKRVLNAYARKPHPLLEEVEFYILVSEGTDIVSLLEEKINIIKNEFSEFKQKFLENLEKIHKA